MDLIRKTKSICPICLNTVEASLVRVEHEVLLRKNCLLHGDFESVVWSGEPSFESWERDFAKQVKSELSPLHLSNKTCPHNCGLCGEHRQSTCTVLLELTENCNLACPVCFASAKNSQNGQFEQLSTIKQKIDWIYEKAGNIILQLSGGEPSLHPKLIEIIEEANKKFAAVQLNTNGIVLGQNENLAFELKKAGLSWVFLQFDGLCDNVNLKMRGARLLEVKQRAIANCAKAGLAVVLVCTIAKGINEHILGELLNFALDNFPTVKGVHFQPMTLSGRNLVSNQVHITLPQVLKSLEEQSLGKVRIKDALASDCEHHLCSFHARYFINKDKSLKPISKNQNQSKASINIPELIENAPRRSINSIARSWQGANSISKAENNNAKNPLAAFDNFIQRAKEEVFSVSCMAFQDAYNLDLDRLKQCCIHIYSDKSGQQKLIPFCAYNLTAQDEQSLYR